MATDATLIESDVTSQLKKSGFYRYVDVIDGDTFVDRSTVFLCPTRGGRPKDEKRPNGESAASVGTIPDQVVQSWLTLVRPPNHAFGFMLVRGDEVASAYNRGLRQILSHPTYSKLKYVLTVEDDNIIPANAVVALQDSIERGPYDAVGGVYFMKGNMAVPMAFGRPGAVDALGAMDMTPVRLTDSIMAPPEDVERKIVEVNGLACGCTLWRLDLFREMDPDRVGKWFDTWTRFDASGNCEVMTQDLYFTRKCRESGKRFAIDTRVMVGHLDPATGAVF